jgi:hypothetical protein
MFSFDVTILLLKDSANLFGGGNKSNDAREEDVSGSNESECIEPRNI